MARLYGLDTHRQQTFTPLSLSIDIHLPEVLEALVPGNGLDCVPNADRLLTDVQYLLFSAASIHFLYECLPLI